MINKGFVEETDKIIKRLKERKITLENGNLLVAKVKTDRLTKGGLYLSDQQAEKEDYKSGFARVIALPTNSESTELQVGDYILHSHEARYLPYPPALRDMLDYMVEEKFIYAVQDNEVIMRMSGEVIQNEQQDISVGVCKPS